MIAIKLVTHSDDAQSQPEKLEQVKLDGCFTIIFQEQPAQWNLIVLSSPGFQAKRNSYFSRSKLF
jgi:hypothetical protein